MADRYGYIKISRKLYATCPFWNERREFSRHEAWEDMIQMAAWRDHERAVGAGVAKLERGELLASVRFLSERWLWSKGKVSRFIRTLQNMNRIERSNRGTSGDTYRIMKYDTYQFRRDTERDSNGTATGRERDSNGTNRKKVKKVSKGKEGKGDVALALLTRDPNRNYELTEDKIREWGESFPGVDVLSECRSARQWLIDNPDKRKTHRGMTGFLGNWLRKARSDMPAAEPENPIQEKIRLKLEAQERSHA